MRIIHLIANNGLVRLPCEAPFKSDSDADLDSMA